MTTGLYRIYDSKTRLLYAGISVTPLHRTQTHSVRSPWWFMADTWSVETFASRTAAEAAEFAAVRDEGPLYNTNYSEWFKGSAADARRAIPQGLARQPVAWRSHYAEAVPKPYRIRRWNWGGRVESLPFPRVRLIAGMLIKAHPHLAEEAEGVPAPWGSHAVVAHAVLTSLVSLDEVTEAPPSTPGYEGFAVVSTALDLGLLTHDEVYGTTNDEEQTA